MTPHPSGAIFAQSLGEYGTGGSLGSAIQQLADAIGSWLGSLSIVTWIVAAIVVAGLMTLRRR